MKNKYNAKKVQAYGYKFDSQAEYAMYCDLRLLEKGKKVRCIVVHPRYTLLDAYTTYTGKKIRKTEYEADFAFYDVEQNRARVVDCKGFKTAVFRLKEKMFNAKYAKDGLELEYTL